MTEKETLSSDPCIKILESMRPAIWAFHHNQFLSTQRNNPPKNAYKLYQMAQEKKSPEGKTIYGSSYRNYPKGDSFMEKGNPCNLSGTKQFGNPDVMRK